MIRLAVIITSLLFATNIIAQDSYEGAFSEKETFINLKTQMPLGHHVGYDNDEGITISIDYGKQGAIKKIIVKSADKTICSEEINFPNKEVEWVKIKKGIWINAIEEKEDLRKSFKGSERIKMHYAGFLETGEPFDNSFIRNRPFVAELYQLIEGFSIGAMNVVPNTIRIIKIAPQQAYGERGAGGIPPNATIYYVIYNLENSSV